MTISVSNNTPRVSYSVAQGQTQTSFTVNFEFFADADLRVFVDNTLKTITTDYTVSGGNGSTGTVTMSVTGATGGSTVVIVRAIALERTTDFPSSGAFNISPLNTELDRIIAIHGDVDDTAERGLRLQESDEAVTTTLPLKDTRKGTVLAFNATTGVPEAGPSISSVTTVATQSANINTVAGISANVTTVAGIAANVTTVAGIASAVSSVAGVASLITSDFVADLNTLATSAIVEDLNILATSDIVSDLNTLATSDIVTDLNLLATSAIVEDLNLLATSTVIADMAQLAGSGGTPNVASLTVSGQIAAASLDISGDVDVDGTLEADAMTLNGTAITTTATLSTGISNTNVLVANANIVDNDFLRIDGTSVEGRSASEVLSDIGAASADDVTALAIALG